MLKNNDNTCCLPCLAANVATSINDISVKPQKSGEQLRLPIPGGLDRNRAMRVKISYSQKLIPYAKTPIWPASNRCLSGSPRPFRCAQHL